MTFDVSSGDARNARHLRSVLCFRRAASVMDTFAQVRHHIPALAYRAGDHGGVTLRRIPTSAKCFIFYEHLRDYLRQSPAGLKPAALAASAVSNSIVQLRQL